MNLLSLVGADLSGRLRAWRRRYASRSYTFDYKHIECTVLEHGKGWKLYATCYCNDPMLNGFDVSPVARVYVSRSYPSQVEAEAHMESQVRQAAARHADAGFYRYRKVLYFDEGRIQDVPLTLYEHYSNGRWVQATHPTGTLQCQGCAYVTDQPICPKCGDLAMSR